MSDPLDDLKDARQVLSQLQALGVPLDELGGN
jgi:hypothetical protein